MYTNDLLVFAYKGELSVMQSACVSNVRVSDLRTFKFVCGFRCPCSWL